jgi:hypothetical protein
MLSLRLKRVRSDNLGAKARSDLTGRLSGLEWSTDRRAVNRVEELPIALAYDLEQSDRKVARWTLAVRVDGENNAANALDEHSN